MAFNIQSLVKLAANAGGPGPLSLASQILALASINGRRDIGAIATTLDTLAKTQPDLVQSVKAELGGLLQPLEQGQLARLTASGQSQTPAPAPTADAPLIGFQEGGVDWPRWIETASRAPEGSPQKIAYDAMVRYAGTTDPKAIELVMAEVAANDVNIEEVRGVSGPLHGGEMRYRIGADLEAIQRQAGNEIRHITGIITAIETNPAASAQDKARLPELRGLLQESANHYALSSGGVSDLRTSGLLSDPRYNATLTIAEAFRRGGDDLAQATVAGGDGPYPVREAATRMLPVIGADRYDRYIESAIAVASLKYIPENLLPANQRENAVRQLGIGFIRAEIDNSRTAGTSAIGAVTPEIFTWQNTNFVMRKAMMQGVSQADRTALEWGQTAARGREIYPTALSEISGGVAGVLISQGGRLIQRTVVCEVAETAETLGTGATAGRRAASQIDYYSPAMQAELPRPYIPATVQRQLGPRPPGMDNPHIHHIVELNGRAGEYRALTRESQDILRQYNIDPIVGRENLVWASNRGHTLAETQRLNLELRTARDRGAPRDAILDILQEAGERAEMR